MESSGVQQKRDEKKEKKTIRDGKRLASVSGTLEKKKRRGARNIEWKVKHYEESRESEYAALASNIVEIRMMTKGLGGVTPPAPPVSAAQLPPTERKEEGDDNENEESEGDDRNNGDTSKPKFRTRLKGIEELTAVMMAPPIKGTSDTPLTITDLSETSAVQIPVLAEPKKSDEATPMDEEQKQQQEQHAPTLVSNVNDEKIESIQGTPEVGISTHPRWFRMAGGPKYFVNVINHFDAIADAEQSETAAERNVGDARKTSDPDPSDIYVEWLENVAVRNAAARSQRTGTPSTSSQTSSSSSRGFSTPTSTTTPTKSDQTGAQATRKTWEATEDAGETWPTHIAYYLFEADEANRERRCVRGDRCISRLSIPHPLGGKEKSGPWRGKGITGTVNPNPPRLGIVLKEYLTPSERQRFDRNNILPACHGPCILCRLSKCMYDSFMCASGAKTSCDPGHRNPVNVEGGYKMEACIQPKPSASNGVVVPVRRFVTSDYIPTTLDDCVMAGIVPLTPGEEARLKDTATQFPTVAGKGGIPKLRGLVENAKVYFFATTRWMSGQATTQGTEPCVTFVVSWPHPPGSARPSLPAFVIPTSGVHQSKSVVTEEKCQQQDATTQEIKKEPNPADDENANEEAVERFLQADEDDIVSNAFGERRGTWNSLTVEVATRLGISIPVAKILTGPFCHACRAVRAAFMMAENVDGRNGNAQSTTQKQTLLPRGVLEELASIARRLNEWERCRFPIPPSEHSILITSIMRGELATSIRLSVASDAQLISQRKTSTKEEKYRNEKTLVEKVNSNKTEEKCPQLPPPPPLRILPFPSDTKHQAVLKGLVEDAAKRYPKTVVAKTQRTRRSAASQAAAATSGNEPKRAIKTLGDLIDERTGRVLSQRYLDRLIIILSEYDSAHRPLRTALLCLRSQGAAIDDTSLIGSVPGTVPAYLRCDINGRNPDDRMTQPWIPRRKTKQVLLGRLRTRIGGNNDYDGMIAPNRAPFVSEHAPTIVKLRFKSPRELIVAALEPLPSSPTTTCTPNVLPGVSRFSDDVTALFDHPVSSLFCHDKGKWIGASERNECIGKCPTLRECMSEFWITLSAVKTLSEEDISNLVATCSTIADVAKLTNALFTDSTAKKNIGEARTAATIIIRVAIAEALRRHAPDSATDLRLSLFAWTHADLAWELSERRRTGMTIDDAEIGSVVIKPDTTTATIVEELYPYDRRATSEEDLTSIAAELSGCGFFEKSSEQSASKTMEHIIKKVFPRACHKRSIMRIMSETENLCPAFAGWLADAIDCFLRGAFPHASVRPTFTTSLFCGKKVADEVREDAARRSIVTNLRDFFERRSALLEKTQTCVGEFGTDQFRASVRLVSVLANVAEAIRGAGERNDARTVDAMATAVKKTVMDAVMNEDMRRIISDGRRYWEIIEALAAPSATTETAERERIAHIINVEIEDAEEIRVALAFLGSGCLSAEIETAVSPIKNAAKRLVACVEDEKRNAIYRRLCARGEGDGGVVANGERTEMARMYGSPFTIECVAEEMGIASGKICKEIPGYIICGLGGAVMEAMAVYAEDVRDATQRVTKLSESLTASKNILSSVRPICAMIVPGSDVLTPLLWLKDNADENSVIGDDTGKWAMIYLMSTAHAMLAYRLPFIPEIDGEVLTRKYASITNDTNNQYTGRKMLSVAKKIYVNAVGFAGYIALLATTYMRATRDMDSLRGVSKRYLEAAEAMGPSFVERHPTLCKSAVRECVMAGLSRNPAIVATFVSRADWFPEFIDNAVVTGDALRRHLCDRGKIPEEGEAAAIARAKFEETWNGKVYRLQKCDFATTIVRSASQHVEDLVAKGVLVDRKYVPSEEKIELIHYYTDAAVRAGGSDPKPDRDRDIDALWRFGLRTHGLDIMRRLHDVYMRSGSEMETHALIGTFATDEFFLVAEYYASIATSLAVCQIRIRSTEWLESCVSAAQSKYGLSDGEYTRELCHLVVCDACETILAQLFSSWNGAVSKVTSCDEVSSGPNGFYFCFRKRITNQQPRQHPKQSTATSSAITHDRRRMADGGRCGWAGFDRLVEPVETKDVHEKKTTCCGKRIKKIYALQRVLMFRRKYGKGDPREHKYPVIMTPCCGMWSRFNFAHYGADGYRCMTCSLSRGTGPVLPDVCGICGKSSMVPESVGVGSMTDQDTQHDSGGVPRTQVELAAFFKAKAKRAEEHSSASLSGTVFGIDGPIIPASDEFDHAIAVIDDIVTGAIIPLGVCLRCHRISTNAGGSVGPVFLSRMRRLVEFAQRTKESNKFRNRMRAKAFC